MRAEDENLLDVGGAAWAGDERDHAGPAACVTVPQEGKRVAQVRQNLRTSGDDEMGRRENGERTTESRARGEDDRSGASDEAFAPSDAEVGVRERSAAVALAGQDA